MAIPVRTDQRFSPQDYLALERLADCKSEYADGEIFAMSGGSMQHNLTSFRGIFTVLSATN